MAGGQANVITGTISLTVTVKNRGFGQRLKWHVTSFNVIPPS